MKIASHGLKIKNLDNLVCPECNKKLNFSNTTATCCGITFVARVSEYRISRNKKKEGINND